MIKIQTIFSRNQEEFQHKLDEENEENKSRSDDDPKNLMNNNHNQVNNME